MENALRPGWLRRFFVFLLNPLTKERKAILNHHHKTGGPLDPDALKTLITESLDGDKAQDIEAIDLRGQSSLADYMIVASGTSSRQVSAMAQKLTDRLKEAGCRGIRMEGEDQGNWVIVDAGDVIVHLFRPEVREFYNIEKMWRIPVVITTSESEAGMSSSA